MKMVKCNHVLDLEQNLRSVLQNCLPYDFDPVVDIREFVSRIVPRALCECSKQRLREEARNYQNLYYSEEDISDRKLSDIIDDIIKGYAFITNEKQ